MAGLVVRGVSVRFGGLVALEDVSFEVAPGSVVGIIGPNGAGKTTLFNVVCGFVRPSSGTMSGRSGRCARRPTAWAQGIARTLQAVGLFPRLSVLENVMVGAANTRRSGFGSALFAMPRSDRDERRLRAEATSWSARLVPRSQIAWRRVCRTRCRSGSRWPARWSAGPAYCCSTNRPAGWARRTYRRSRS